MSDGYHLKLSLGRALWEDLLHNALPVGMAGGEFNLAQNARSAVRRLQVRQRISGLLEDRQPPAVLVRAKDRARASWHRRRESLYRRVDQVIRVEGEWRLELDDMGTNLRYGKQEVTADAFLKGGAEGTIYLLSENVELPFLIEKRIGASVTLGQIHYDEGPRAVTGTLQHLAVHLGDNVVYELVSRLVELALEKQLENVNPVPILRREQVEDMVSGLGGSLRLDMGVEDLALDIDEKELTLRVRFGFTRKQIEDTQRAGDEAF